MSAAPEVGPHVLDPELEKWRVWAVIVCQHNLSWRLCRRRHRLSPTTEHASTIDPRGRRKQLAYPDGRTSVHARPQALLGLMIQPAVRNAATPACAKQLKNCEGNRERCNVNTSNAYDKKHDAACCIWLHVGCI